MGNHSLQLHRQKHTTMSNLGIILLICAVCYCIEGQTTIPALCDLPKAEGTGSEVRVYLYYDKAADKCNPFRYSGAGGNANRFIAEKYCMRNCSARAEELYPTDKIKACHLPKASGECFGTYLRYYYDAAHGKCKKFFWTGCVGNGNRFFDLQRCNETCSGVLDESLGMEDEDPESDTPVGIILGVVLGIIGAIILTIVLVLTLKKKPIKSKKRNAKEGKGKDNSGAPGPEIPLQTNN